MKSLRLPFGPEITVDLFAGGGGASLGIEWGMGRPVDVAVNHDPEAVALHAANHPWTRHYCESVFRVDPVSATGNRPVGLLWASPDCTHHSKAKGGKPVSSRRRGLAWVVVKWARRCRPRVIMLENVEEFADWGPLTPDGRPCRERKGKTFLQWVGQLERLGYRVEWRKLRACDYGAPTIRQRLFVIARCDGLPIVWPKPTHGAPDSLGVTQGKLLPWRSAAECIDWAVPCPSIFERRRPLADATQRRIARGVMRYVVYDPYPFIAPISVGGTHQAHVAAFLAKHYGGNYTGPGHDLRGPTGTVTTVDHHALVTVTLDGEPPVITDIGMRMLTPRELFRAQGFPDTYIIDRGADGKPISKTAQVRMCGNAVPPVWPAALIRANYSEILRSVA